MNINDKRLKRLQYFSQKLQDPFNAELTEINQNISSIIEKNNELFPRIFDNWKLLSSKIQEEGLLQIFVDYYFNRDKFFLFPEKREIEIDLLNSLQLLEPIYRFELTRFQHYGITSCKKWQKKNENIFPIINTNPLGKEEFSLTLKKFMRTIDSSQLKKSKLENDSSDIHEVSDFKQQITKIVNKYSQRKSSYEKIIFSLIEGFINDKYYMSVQGFIQGISEHTLQIPLKKIFNDIDGHIKDSIKIVRIEQLLRELIYLEDLLEPREDFFGDMDPGLFNEKRFDRQLQAVDNFVSFQFYTDLLVRRPDVWNEIMKGDPKIRSWYIEKLEEVPKIDKIRYNKNLKHRNEIIMKLKEI